MTLTLYHLFILAFRFLVFTCLIAPAIYLTLNYPDSTTQAAAFAFLVGFAIALIVVYLS